MGAGVDNPRRRNVKAVTRRFWRRQVPASGRGPVSSAPRPVVEIGQHDEEGSEGGRLLSSHSHAPSFLSGTGPDGTK